MTNTLIVLLSLLLLSCGGSIGGSSQAPDPAIVDLPIVYVKRPLPVDDDNARVALDVRDPAAFHRGAELILRDRATSTAKEKSLTADIFLAPADEAGDVESPEEPDMRYDVKDLSVSADGKKLLFALRAPELPELDEDEQPKWDIWEYDLQTDTQRRVIASDINADAGHDIAPAYLPDGKIVFSSTRQRLSRAILLDEGKPQFAAQDESGRGAAFNLHVMEDDGSNIQQISFNQSHDLDPLVAANGKIMFSRWDNSRGGRNAFSLYQMNQDGSDLELLYGAHSHNTGSENATVQFRGPQELPNNDLLVALSGFSSQTLGGNFAQINAVEFSDNAQPAGMLVEDPQTLTVFGQQLLFEQVRTDDAFSVGGRYGAVYPLNDGSTRLLVSWSQCRMLQLDEEQLLAFSDGLPLEVEPALQRCPAPNADGSVDPSDGAVEAPAFYGIWIYDPRDSAQLPIVIAEPGAVYSDIVALEERSIADFSATVFDDNPVEAIALADTGYGVLDIRSVYDFDGVDLADPDIATLADPAQTSASARPERFVRIVKAVSRPDDELVDFGNIPFNGNRPMREILGYAPIEPDGSVKVKVPANVAFTLSVLDQRGHRISESHDNWLQLRPGEVKECRGCHDADATTPHGRLDAQLPSAYDGAVGDGLAFPNTLTSLIPEAGETMAQAYWRSFTGDDDTTTWPGLSSSISYSERWSGNSGNDFSLDYSDYIDPSNPANPLPAPTSQQCLQEWQSVCRIVINYEEHVRPLWTKDRSRFDDNLNLIEDNTCVACHSVRDADGVSQLPAGQLELDDNGRRASYEDLFQSDVQLVLEDGAVIVLFVPATQEPLFETDPITGEVLTMIIPEGEPGAGQEVPIPRLITIPVNASMSGNGAQASTRFFDVFDGGGSISHQGMLTPGELKLLAEWLDIGAQYYNNPFDVPVN